MILTETLRGYELEENRKVNKRADWKKKMYNEMEKKKEIIYIYIYIVVYIYISLSFCIYMYIYKARSKSSEPNLARSTIVEIFCCGYTIDD